jgi:hypothetical protein
MFQSWSKKNYNCNFCIHCESTKKDRADFGTWSAQFRTTLENMFEIPPERILFCSLHAKIRITSKLLRLLAQTASDNNLEHQFISVVRDSGWYNFDTWIPEGRTKVKISGEY